MARTRSHLRSFSHSHRVSHSRRPRGRLALLGSCAAVLLVHGAALRADEDPPQREQEDKLGERLIRESVGGSEDIMQEIVRLMGESARQLDIKFDAGGETQSVQAEIVDNLDEAIKYAAAQRRLARQSSSRQRSDKRRLPGAQPPNARSDQQAGKADTSDDTAETTETKGSPSVLDMPEGSLKETRRAWGHLPERERDELIQGRDEAFLEAYRAWIEMYFKALQEAE